MSFINKLFRWKKNPFGAKGEERKVENIQEAIVKNKSAKSAFLNSEPHGSGKFAQVIVRPRISEKTAALQALNKYVFDVNPLSAEQDVACAIYSLYGIKPVSVNVIKMGGKKVRFGRVVGSTKSWKKAIVTLPPGKAIEGYKK